MHTSTARRPRKHATKGAKAGAAMMKNDEGAMAKDAAKMKKGDAMMKKDDGMMRKPE